MSGDDELDGMLAMRRRRLRFRAWHRGMREVDLLLGPFADRHAEGFDADGLAGFEALLEVPDPEILGWITGEIAIPPESDTPMLRRVVAFNYRPASER